MLPLRLLPAALVLVCNACQTQKDSVWDLSMRFTHPELYQSRSDFPRENAVRDMRKDGILRSGMKRDDVRHILGDPDGVREYDGTTETISFGGQTISTEGNFSPARIIWEYMLKRSKLEVHMKSLTAEAVDHFEWNFETAEGTVMVPNEKW